MPRIRTRTLQNQHAALGQTGVAWKTSKGSLRRYGFRHAVHHLLEADSAETATEMVTEFAYAMARLKELNAAGVLDMAEDYEQLWLTQKDHFVLANWGRLLQSKGHILSRGNPQWSADRILLQLAIEEADSSPLTQAAEDWLETSACDWTWIRNSLRVEKREIDPCWAVLEGHENLVRGALFWTDGYIISWSADHTLEVWDYDSGASQTLWGHEGGVSGALKVDERHLLSWSTDGTLRLWDVDDFNVVRVFTGHTGPIMNAKLLPKGRILSESFIGGDREYAIWNIETGECLSLVTIPDSLRLENERILSWSPENTPFVWEYDVHKTPPVQREDLKRCIPLSEDLLATLDGEELCIWNLASSTLIARVPGWGDRTLHYPQLIDGDRLICWSSGADPYRGPGILQMVHLRTSEMGVRLEGHTGPVKGLEMWQDGQLLSWSIDGTLRLWDTETGALLRVFAGHTQEVSGVKRLQDGRFVSWSWDGTLQIWSTTQSTPVHCLVGHTGPIEAVHQLSNGRLLSWVGEMGDLGDEDYTLRLWDPDTGQCVALLQGHTQALVGFLPLPEDLFVTWSQESTLRVWDATVNTATEPQAGHTGQIAGVKCLGSQQVLSWSTDGTMVMWDTDAGKPLKRLNAYHGQHVFQTGASTVGTVLGGHIDGLLTIGTAQCIVWSENHHDATRIPQVWDLHTGEKVAELVGHTGALRGMLALSTGNVLSWCHDGSLRMWSPQTGTCLALMSSCHASQVQLLRNGEILSIGEDPIHSICLWDPESGQLRNTLIGHDKKVLWVKELENDNLLSKSEDGTFRIWDRKTGEEKISCRDRGRTASVVSGARVLSWSDNTLHLWCSETGARLADLARPGEGARSHINGALLLANENAVSWHYDGTLSLWNLKDSHHIATMTGHTAHIHEVIERPNHQFLSYAGVGQLILWCAKTGERLGVWPHEEAPFVVPELWRLYCHKPYMKKTAADVEERWVGSASEYGVVVATADQSPGAWHGEKGTWKIQGFTESGTIVVSSGNRLLFLHQWLGNTPVSG